MIKSIVRIVCLVIGHDRPGRGYCRRCKKILNVVSYYECLISTDRASAGIGGVSVPVGQDVSADRLPGD